MTAEIRAAVPPEVGVPIPLGDAECPPRPCTDCLLAGTHNECEHLVEVDARIPVVPTCPTCDDGYIYLTDEAFSPRVPCPDCTDGVARRWVGTVTVAGGDCPDCIMDDYAQPTGMDIGGHLYFYECSTCDSTMEVPDRRYRLQGSVVPVVDETKVIAGAWSDSFAVHPFLAIRRGRVWLFGPHRPAADITWAFVDGPPAVGTWAVVPETIEEEA